MAITITQGSFGDTIDLETALSAEKVANTKIYSMPTERININGRVLEVGSDEVLSVNGFKDGIFTSNVDGGHTTTTDGITTQPGATVMLLGSEAGISGEDVSQAVRDGVYNFSNSTLIMTKENGNADDIYFPAVNRAGVGVDLNLTNATVVGPDSGTWILHGRSGAADFSRGGTFNGTEFSGNIVIQWPPEADWVNIGTPSAGFAANAQTSNAFRAVNVTSDPVNHSRWTSFIDSRINWRPLNDTINTWARIEVNTDQFSTAPTPGFPIDFLFIGDNDLFTNANLNGLRLAGHGTVTPSQSTTNYYLRRMFAWNPQFRDATTTALPTPTLVGDVKLDFNLTGTNFNSDEAIVLANSPKNAAISAYKTGTGSLNHNAAGYFIQSDAVAGGSNNPVTVSGVTFACSTGAELSTSINPVRTVNGWSYTHNVDYIHTTEHHRQSERGVFEDVRNYDLAPDRFVDNQTVAQVNALDGTVATGNTIDNFYRRGKANWYTIERKEDFQDIFDTNTTNNEITFDRNVLFDSTSTNNISLTNTGVTFKTSSDISADSNFTGINTSGSLTFNSAGSVSSGEYTTTGALTTTATNLTGGTFKGSTVSFNGGNINGATFEATSTTAGNSISLQGNYNISNITATSADDISLIGTAGTVGDNLVLTTTAANGAIDLNHHTTGDNDVFTTNFLNNWDINPAHGTTTINEATDGTGTRVTLSDAVANATYTVAQLFGGADTVPGTGKLRVSSPVDITIQTADIGQADSRWTLGTTNLGTGTVTVEALPLTRMVRPADYSLGGYFAVTVNNVLTSEGIQEITGTEVVTLSNTVITAGDTIRYYYKPANTTTTKYSTNITSNTWVTLLADEDVELSPMTYPNTIIANLATTIATAGTPTVATKNVAGDTTDYLNALTLPITGAVTRINGSETQAVYLQFTDTLQYFNTIVSNGVNGLFEDVIVPLTEVDSRINFNYVTLTSGDNSQQKVTSIENSGNIAAALTVQQSFTAGGVTTTIDLVDIVDNPMGITISQVIQANSQSDFSMDIEEVNNKISWQIADGTRTGHFKPNNNGRYKSDQDYTVNTANQNTDD